MNLRIGVIGTGPHGLLLINTLDKLEADILHEGNFSSNLRDRLWPAGFVYEGGSAITKLKANVMEHPVL